MRKIAKGILLIVAMFISLSVKTATLNSSNSAMLYPAVSFQLFYDELSPYGTWVDYPNYGYVWAPRVEPGFMPYRDNGHWVYTEHGWTWFSGYPWGWAPFHYGRWFFDDNYGWMWMPGYEWAPAWVTWGNYGENYGWAPIEPNVVVYEGYRPPVHYWCFVPREHIAEVNVGTYVVRDHAVVHRDIIVINNSNNFNRAVYNAGPRPEEVERYSGRRVVPYKVEEREHPLKNREVQNIHKGNIGDKPVPVYRPQINKETGAQHPAPAKVEKLENLKRVPKPENKERHEGNEKEHDRK